MKKIVSVVNLKGGVGKTTSAVNIAACWGEMGKKVLLLDLDPQGSSSIHVGAMSDGSDLLDALRQGTSLPVMTTEVPGVSLVPSGPNLAAARQQFAGSFGNDLLKASLDRTQGDWDYIVIDCPPSMGILATNALMACRHVVVPIEASFLGLHGLKQMVQSIESISSQNPHISLDAIIPCRAQPRRRIHWEIMGRLEAEYPGMVSPIIHENVTLAEAPGRGKPVIFTARISRGSDDYRLVSLWLADRLGQSTAEAGSVVEVDSFMGS